MTGEPDALELAGRIEAEIGRHRDAGRAVAEKRYLPAARREALLAEHRTARAGAGRDGGRTT